MRRTGRCAGAAALAVLAIGASLQARADYAAGMDALAVKDYARARAAFEAEPNNAEAVYQLTRLARAGIGEPRNEVRVFGLVQRAAELGHEHAKFDRAVFLAVGRGTTAEPERALRQMEELDAAGYAAATVYLGRALMYGWFGRPKDEARAVALFEKAAAANNDSGTTLLALALQSGTGVAANPERAAALLKAGTEQGMLEAQVEYARTLTYGVGVPKDEAAGTALYRKAAESGDAIAQHGVALAYLNGRGVPRDDAAGARWCDAAARQGNSFAQLRMGDLYRHGIGVPRLRGHAYFWYSIAARQSTVAGEQARERRAVLAREMSAAEIESQARRVQAFQVQPGFRPREQPLPALARGEQVKLGSVTVAVPAPRGYMNNWEFVEMLQKVSPNSPELEPRLLVLTYQDDMSRLRLGLPGPIRSIEVSAHSDEDNMISATLFADIRKHFHGLVQTAVSSGRYAMEPVIRDDDEAYAIVRQSAIGENRVEGIALVLVNGRVLVLTFTGYEREHLAELRELVGTFTRETSARNRRFGMFSGNPQ